ncbi:hypothetical protein [Kineosporia babensis]|uniref:Uncharacterized protein n=1 Tax=Kineosporia babensis TaxID=499548 RepID=A0A9X1NE17_9ACTN|nr:hypothetical protein [Kineosporia babensis]MCD5312075.1 hypothetical protein [Kineosporia babensis]
MRFAFQHSSARVASVVAAAGLIVAPATAGSASAATAAPTADCTWELTRAAVPEGLAWFNVTGASEQYFVGSGMPPYDYGDKAVLWSERGSEATVLDSPGKGAAQAADVTDHGLVVANDLVEQRPYLWSKGKITRLTMPAGASAARAGAINEAGTIVGEAQIDGKTHGIVWSASKPRKYLDLGYGDGVLNLHDIDDAGTVVASTSEVDSNYSVGLKGTVGGGLAPILESENAKSTTAHAVNGRYILGGVSSYREDGDYWDDASAVWDGDSYTAMGTNESPNAINSSGLLAGNSSVRVSSWTTSGATVWQDGVKTLLPTLLPDTGSYAEEVTEDGVVIGTSWSSTDSEWPNPTPVTWTCS